MSQIESQKPASFIGKDGKPVTAVALSEATAEQIARWKEQHGRVFSVNSDGHTAYFRKPTRKELSYMLAMQGKPVEATEHLLSCCFLGGDRVFLTDTEYMMGCDKLVEKLVEVKTVELGEL